MYCVGDDRVGQCTVCMYCVGGDRVGQCTVWVVTGWDSVLCVLCGW